MSIKFVVCKHCGNIAGMVKDSGVPMMCCGQPMEELIPNTQDAAQEKHVPSVKIDEKKVDIQVGDILHPMDEDHYIEWIYLKTDKGGQRRTLKPGDEPKALFGAREGKPEAVYAYGNLHGLWKVDL